MTLMHKVDEAGVKKTDHFHPIDVKDALADGWVLGEGEAAPKEEPPMVPTPDKDAKTYGKKADKNKADDANSSIAGA